MPNRMIRPSWITSRKHEALSAEGERLAVRLLLVVDDFGRFSADPMRVLAATFPTMLDRVSVADVGRWLAELEASGVVRTYEHEGERYLAWTSKWDQRTRIRVSKFPAPPWSEDLAEVRLSADGDHDAARHDWPAEYNGSGATPPRDGATVGLGDAAGDGGADGVEGTTRSLRQVVRRWTPDGQLSAPGQTTAGQTTAEGPSHDRHLPAEPPLADDRQGAVT